MVNLKCLLLFIKLVNVCKSLLSYGKNMKPLKLIKMVKALKVALLLKFEYLLSMLLLQIARLEVASYGGLTYTRMTLILLLFLCILVTAALLLLRLHLLSKSCVLQSVCCRLKIKGGGTIDLEPCLTHSSTVEPTLAPVAVERTMTTRAAASNALRQQRFVREVTIQYNLCNEPWIKYSISIVADKRLKKPLYTSARLKKGEVLYLETHSCRYELCFIGEKMVKATQASQVYEADMEKSQNHHSQSSNGDKNDSDNIMIDVFRWSRCKKPLPQKVMRSIGIPLPLEHVEVLEDKIDWEDVQWSQTGVWIAGKEYTLARVHFLSSS